MTVTEFKDLQKNLTYANIIASMKGDGWRADQPMMQTSYQPGVDTILGEDFINGLNKEINTFIKKINRKILKQVKVVEKECIETFKGVDGMLDEVYTRFPVLDPDYKAPELPEKIEPALPKDTGSK